MSTVTQASSREHRVTVHTLARAKREGRPFAMLTAYDHAFARIFDQAGIDVLLVGDSLGNVVQGLETTLPVTLDEVVYHTRLVARAARRALVVADMPFGSYQASPRGRGAERDPAGEGRRRPRGEARGRRGRVSATIARDRRRADPGDGPRRADAPVRPRAGRLPRAGPQRGRARARARRRPRRARSRAPSPWCSRACRGISRGRSPATLAIPTIGIGAGAACDGQVLVMHDLLGLNDSDAELREAVRGPRRGRLPGRARLRGRRRGPEVPGRRARLPLGAGRADRPRGARAPAARRRRARRGAADRPGAHHGRAPRRPPRPRRRGAAARGPRRGLDLREPDPVRSRRGLRRVSAPLRRRRRALPRGRRRRGVRARGRRALSARRAELRRGREALAAALRRIAAGPLPRCRHGRREAAARREAPRGGVRRQGLPAGRRWSAAWPATSASTSRS